VGREVRLKQIWRKVVHHAIHCHTPGLQIQLHQMSVVLTMALPMVICCEIFSARHVVKFINHFGIIGIISIESQQLACLAAFIFIFFIINHNTLSNILKGLTKTLVGLI
jgi:hypothetical protein